MFIMSPPTTNDDDEEEDYTIVAPTTTNDDGYIHHSFVLPVKHFSSVDVGGGINLALLNSPKQGGPVVLFNAKTQNNFNTSTTNVSFGHGSHLENTPGNDGSFISFVNTTGSPISYHSGQPPGRSVRLDLIPFDGPWADESGSLSWKDKPEYLMPSGKGFRNHEITFIIRPHNPLGTHQSCAFKLQGKDNDIGRSVIEFLYPEDTHPKAEANLDYEHFPYIHIPTTQLFAGDKLEDNKWVGIKVDVKVIPGVSITMRMYVDTDPFNTQNGGLNNNWKLKAICTNTGAPEYDNIPCTWGGRKNYLRVDGFASIDVALAHDIEIDDSSSPPPPSPIPVPPPVPVPTPVPNPTPIPTPTPTPTPVPPTPTPIPITPIPIPDPVPNPTPTPTPTPVPTPVPPTPTPNPNPNPPTIKEAEEIVINYFKATGNDSNDFITKVIHASIEGQMRNINAKKK